MDPVRTDAPAANGRPRHLRRLAIAAATALAALTAAPAAAQAGDYTVWTCRGPAGEPVSARAWQLGGSPITQMTDSCASGGELTVFVPAGRSGTYVDDAGARFQTFGGSRITAYRIWRSAQTAGPGSGSAGFYTDVLEGDFGFWSDSADSCRNTSGCLTKGTPADKLGGAGNLVARSGRSLGSVSIAAGCSAPISGSYSCADTGGINAAFRLYRAAFEIDDSAAPAVAGKPDGDLLADEPLRGTRTLSVDATDDGAGVSALVARVGGQVVAEVRAGGDCAEPYTRPSPCPGAATLELALDTIALGDGDHQLDVALVDGAGNESAVLSRTVRVDNSVTPPVVDPPEVDPPVVDPPVVLPPPPPPPPVVIVRDPPPPAVRGDYVVTVDRTRVAAGGKGRVAGIVAERGGGAQSGATVALEGRFYGPFGGEWRELRTLRADAAGRFAFAIPKEARQLRVRLLPERASTTTFVSRQVDVVSRVRLTATARPRALRNGGTLRLTGRLTGAGASARGKQLLVQAVVGGHWQTVDRVSADAKGRYEWRYRFQRTRTEALYSFRVVAKADGDNWPWKTTTSPKLRVRVRP